MDGCYFSCFQRIKKRGQNLNAMGKTRRKDSHYNNFVDSDKNNLIVVKPGKVIEQIKTFQGEDMFVVQKPNTYVDDSGVIIKTSTDNNSSVDFIGVPDSSFSNATNVPSSCPTIAFSWGASNVANTNDKFQVNVLGIQGGTAPYSVVINYASGGQTNTTNLTLSGGGVGSSGAITGFSTPNGVLGGAYNISVSVSDANGCSATTNIPSQQVTLVGTTTTTTPPSQVVAMISVGAIVPSGTSGFGKVNVNPTYQFGVPPYTLTYEVLDPSNQSVLYSGTSTTSATSDSKQISGLTYIGQAIVKVSVKDSNNDTSSMTQNVNITGITNSGNNQYLPNPNPQIQNLVLNATNPLLQGDVIQANCTFTGGVAPYKVEWTIVDASGNNVVSKINTTSGLSDELLPSPSGLAQGRYNVKVVVTDANNFVATQNTNVDVKGKATDIGGGGIIGGGGGGGAIGSDVVYNEEDPNSVLIKKTFFQENKWLIFLLIGIGGYLLLSGEDKKN